MDFNESIEVVYEKVKELDPEHAAKIVGYILLEEHGEQELIRLALGTRNMLIYAINRVKRALNLCPPQPVVIHNTHPPPQGRNPTVSNLPAEFMTPTSSHQFPMLHAPPTPEVYNMPVNTYYNVPMYQPPMYAQFPYMDPSAAYYHQHPQQLMQMQPYFPYQQPQFMPPPEGPTDQYGSYFQGGPEPAWNPRRNRRSTFPHEMRFCQSFGKGFCKYGGQCKFLHAVNVADDFIMVLGTPNSNEEVKEYHVLSHISVKELEAEVGGILKSKGPTPIPTATLPTLYQEKYGKKLHADGYFTEKYMRGKVICGLAELLSHMTSSIRVFERDGKTYVILAEDVQKYMKSLQETNKQEQQQCQIYLTFPPHSSFSHKDIYDYFEHNFGRVKCVRIPTQEQRMYGFVTFIHQETVTSVLTKGNPHLICGMRVLAKPYRGKHTSTERKAEETPQRSTGIVITEVPSNHQSSASSSAGSSSSNSTTQINEQQEDRKGKKIVETAITGPSSCQDYHPRGASTSYSGKGKGVMIEEAQENDARFEEYNLPDNPFAFEFEASTSHE